MYNTLYNKIDRIAEVSENKDETWISLNISGRYRSQYSKTIFSELKEVLEMLGKGRCISFRVGNTPMTIDDLLVSLVDGILWSVNINKQSFMGDEEEVSNFFYSLDDFKHWAERTDPFSSSNPFNNHLCKIEVNGLPSSFGGPNFLVSDDIGDIQGDANLTYEHDCLKSTLRQFTDTKREIHPEKHYVSFGAVDECSRFFYRNSLKCLTIAICDELYEDKVVLRGVRRLEFSLQNTQYENVQLVQAQESLREAFCWVFCGDSRYELRHKLLMDRLTLDLPQNQSFYDSVIPLISHASRQAAERYNYAFFERSNEYQKELQQFLKELHTLCDSYSTKVRSLLGNFLRDALAGLLTVAITIFARIRELEKLDSGNVLNYVFYAFGAYLLISCIAQAIVDWKDLGQSEKEIDYWKSVSREYMRSEDFAEHKKKTVSERKKQAIIQYVCIAVLYLLLAGFSFHVPEMWSSLSVTDKDTQVENAADSIGGDVSNTLTIDSIDNGTDTLSRDRDTAVYHTPGRK